VSATYTPGILGRKLGMSQIFEESGLVRAITAIEAGPCTVTQVKTPEKDGYSAIQIGYGATGTIQGNSVFDDIWAPDTINDAGDAAAGILLYASSGVYVYGNNVGDTQFGIAVVTDPAFPPADSNRIKANQVSGTHIFDGIDVCSNNNRIRDNIVNTIDEAGIHIDSTCTGGNSGNIVTNNTINEACAGLLTGATPQDNVLVPNFLFNVTNTQLAGDTCGSGPAISAGTTAGANLPHHVAGTHRNYAPVRP